MFPSAASGSQANPFAGTPVLSTPGVPIGSAVEVLNAQGSGLLTGISLRITSATASFSSIVDSVEIDGINIMTGTISLSEGSSSTGPASVAVPITAKFNSSLRITAHSTGSTGSGALYVSYMLGV